jgi:hypothetical protein
LKVQRRARGIYLALLRLRFRLTGANFESYIEHYHSLRGMKFEHDVHDWMGGYSYESISGAEVEALMQRLAFRHVSSATTPTTVGFFGSGCDEYLYRRAG